MSGGSYAEEMGEEEEDCIVEMGGIGEVEEADPLGDLEVKGEPGWMTGRVDGGNRKRTNDKGNGHGDLKRKKVEPTKVGGTRPPPKKGGARPPPKIRLLSHCVFCLRSISKNTGLTRKQIANMKETESLQEVPRASFPFPKTAQLFSTFNQLWPYLHHKWEGSDDLITFIERNGGKCEKLTRFEGLPTICCFCGDMLKCVEGLLSGLGEQIRNLAGVLQESKAGGGYSWRAENFERRIRTSRLYPEEIQTTLEFIFGKKDMNESSSELPTDVKPSVKPVIGEVAYQKEPECQDLLSPSLSQLAPTPQDSLEGSEGNLNPSPVPGPVEESEAEEGSEMAFESDPDYIKSEEEEEYSTSSNEESPSEEEDKPEVASSPDGDDPNVNCNICGKKLCNKYALDGHKRRLHGIETFRKPPTNDNLIQNTGFDSFTCTVEGCGQTFPKMYLARAHQKRHHKMNLDPSLECDLCGKLWRSKRELLRHKESHGNNRRFPGSKCDLCKVDVPKEKIFEHVRDHVGDEYVLRCPNPSCYYAAAQPSSIPKHLSVRKSCLLAISEGDKKLTTMFSCDECGYSTKMGNCLRAHLNQDHENATKNFPCPISGCEQRFTVKQSVVIHLPLHDFSQGLTSQFCPLCSSQINLDKMEEHLKDKHQVPEIIKCKQCSFLFSTREQLIEHLFDHRFGGALCDICDDGVKYSRHSHLLDHYFKVHKIGVRYACEECDCVFLSKYHLTDHINMKHKREESTDLPEKKKFKCEECDAEFKFKMSLREHNIRLHGAEPFICTFCTEKFLTRDSLYKHLREHRGVVTPGSQGGFKCDVEGCGKIFNAKKSLKHHHKIDHLGIRSVCDICGKSVADENGLRKHKASVHSDLRPYICDTCGESFKTGKSLKIHKLIHTGERPFACEICGQRFRHKEVLRRHLVSHQKKGNDFKPNGPMKQIRKRVEKKSQQS